jgi:hypothetical protein
MRARVLALAISLAGSTSLVAQAPPLPPRVRADTTTYVPRYEMPNGRQLVVVYVGGSETQSIQAFTNAVRAMKPLLARQAALRGLPLSIIGVSLDWDVEQSFARLRSMGAWDEVVLGNNWINVGAQRFVWGTEGKPITPQIIMLERDVTTSGQSITFGQERRLGGVVGGGEIIDWVRRGAPLPDEVKR